MVPNIGLINEHVKAKVEKITQEKHYKKQSRKTYKKKKKIGTKFQRC